MRHSLSGISQTPKLASMFALFRPSHKTDARCRRLPFTTGVWRNRRAATARPGRRGDRITGHAIILECCDAHSTSGVGHSRLRWSRPRLVHVRFNSDSDRQPSKRDPALRAMYGRRPRCKRNLTFLRSVRVQPCMRPVFAWRSTFIAMRPLWPLALM